MTWRAMSRNSGLPNRLRWSDWHALFEVHGFSIIDVWVNRDLDGPLAEPVRLEQWELSDIHRKHIRQERRWLASPFAQRADDDLGIMGVIATLDST